MQVGIEELMVVGSKIFHAMGIVVLGDFEIGSRIRCV